MIDREKILGIEQKAETFARLKHGEISHKRKYTGEPYTVHLEEVVKIVKGIPHTPEMIAAAWLHDTVEDTKTTIDEIKEEFGNKVAQLVEMLTDVSKSEQGNRVIRKNIDLEHTAKASSEAKTIKLADLISNSRSIVDGDAEFARVFLEEKARLLQVLKQGNQTLWKEAFRLMKDGMNKLQMNEATQGSPIRIGFFPGSLDHRMLVILKQQKMHRWRTIMFL